MTSGPQPQPAAEQWTIKRVLTWSTDFLGNHGSDSPRLDAELLLAHACGCQRIQLYTNYDRVLTDDQRARMRELVRRRAQAEPVAYLVGYREFFGLDFEVGPAVLIPRPDTETLVRAALEVLKQLPAPTVIDIGTGSGCIAVALAVNSQATVTAVDISAEALEVAKKNAERHKVADRIEFTCSDLFAAVPETTVDLIVSNPPYITETEHPGLQKDVRDHEPIQALVAGKDGLDVVRRLIQDARSYLRDGGHLMLEIDGSQAQVVADLLSSAGYGKVQIQKDLCGIQRVVHASA